MPIKERSGVVISNKMEKTIVVSIENRITHKKYKKQLFLHMLVSLYINRIFKTRIIRGSS
jgi:ribosomal protein S17